MTDRFADDPLSRHLLGLPKPKPNCTCNHAFELHRAGPCAMNRGAGIPGSCWCDGYEPADEKRADFPIQVLEQPKDE